MTTAVATSLVVIVVNSTAGFAAHLNGVSIDTGIAVAFTSATVLGSLAAGRLTPRLPQERLRRSFAYLVLAVAAYGVVHTPLDPGGIDRAQTPCG